MLCLEHCMECLAGGEAAMLKEESHDTSLASLAETLEPVMTTQTALAKLDGVVGRPGD